MGRLLGIVMVGLMVLGLVPPLYAQSAGAKPNILVIWGDDIGTWNISYNNHGMMGYQTPLREATN